MDSSTTLLHQVDSQEMSSNSLENMLVCSKSQQEKKPRPQPEQALKCPRCDSTNTKFCYYNNYSLSQPRYFCKSCRRYWTKGGTLRNVPVGGGCRKNKRPSSSSKKTLDQPLTSNSSILPSLSYDCNDLTLAFSRLQRQSNGQLGFDDREFSVLGNSNVTHSEFLGNPSIPSFFLDTHNSQNDNFNNVCYGYGNGNVGETMIPYEDMNGVSMKQEYCGKDGDNKVLWGFPWQLNGDGNIGELDSTRQTWNGFSTPSWHGLLNSPLM